MEVDAAGWTSIVLGQSFDPTWRASINGRDLGPPIALDTMTGWMIDRDDRLRIEASVGAQPVYVASLVVSGIGIVVCIALAVWPRRRAR
jgi:arabinofuranan 3-O-arabinosyltransferase